MKKRLLAMLLAVVTTITSVPTPVYAAADDAVVDYVDEETEADADVEEIVPEEAEAIEVTDAAPAEEAVAEENTEAVVAADEVKADFVEEAAPEKVTAPAAETVKEDVGYEDVKHDRELVEENAVMFTNISDWDPVEAEWVNHNVAPNAASLYGNYNYAFDEGEYDYNGGIYDNKVIYVTPDQKAAALNNEDVYAPMRKYGETMPEFTYKFSVAKGWDKDDKSKLKFEELTAGKEAAVLDGGLVVSVNASWLKDAGDPKKIDLVEGTDYTVDKDQKIWFKDDYGIERELSNLVAQTNDDIIANGDLPPVNVDADGVRYYVNEYQWSGYINGSWDTQNIYRKYKQKGVAPDYEIDEEYGPYYRLDDEHNTLGEEDQASYYTYGDDVYVEVDFREGIDYVTEDDGMGGTNVFFIDDDGEKQALQYDYRDIDDDDDNLCIVNYEWRGEKNGYYAWHTVYRAAKRASNTDPWEEYGPYYGNVRKAFSLSSNSLSIVNAKKAGVYTVKAEISYTVSRNKIPNGTGTNPLEGSGDIEYIKVTDVGYATIFVRIPIENTAGWGTISYTLGDGDQKKTYIAQNGAGRVYEDYAKIAGLTANQKYKVYWEKDDVATGAGAWANNIYTADKNGEFGSDKYWAPHDNGGDLIYISKVSDLEANGNCDSAFKDLNLNTDGASYFDKNVFVKEAPGLYGDKDHNNYGADQKETVKVDGIYGNNKFLYVRDVKDTNNNGVIDATERTARGDDIDPAGVEYSLDEEKGTIDVYPKEAGIRLLTAPITYEITDTNYGVKYNGNDYTTSLTPVVMVVKEHAPEGKIVGADNTLGITLKDEEGNDVLDENNNTIPVSLIKISNLEAGSYRLRSVSNNGAILYDALYNGLGNTYVKDISDKIAARRDGTKTVDVRRFNGSWTTNDVYCLYIDTSWFTPQDIEQGVWLEKVNADTEVLNASQKILLSAENVYVNIIPPMAGHTPVKAEDVERGTIATKNLNNINILNAFNIGQEGYDYNFFYNVTNVTWEGATNKDGFFEKDKEYSATVTLTISSNNTISSNMAFAKNMPVENIHINDGLTLNTDAGRLSIAVDPSKISIVSNTGKVLTFKVTFPKAFVQYDVHRIDVTANGRTVVGNGGLADPVIYVAPGEKTRVTVEAVNKWGRIPSLPSISFNGTLNNGKFLWDEENFKPAVKDISAQVYDEENFIYYTITTNVNNDKPYRIVGGTINDDFTYDEMIEQYINKYTLIYWDDNTNASSLVFTISGNVAASGDDSIKFTAQDGLVETKPIAVRYYKKAATPDKAKVEYDREITDPNAPANREIDGKRYADFITGLEPHTWYLIDGNAYYSSDKGELYVEDWMYMDWLGGPANLQTAYNENPKQATSDPYPLTIKRTYNYNTLYVAVNAPEKDRMPVKDAEVYYVDSYDNYIGTPRQTSVSEDQVTSFVDKNGAVVEAPTVFGEKGTEYTVNFVLKLDTYVLDEDNNVVLKEDDPNAFTFYRGFDSKHVKVVVPGAVGEVTVSDNAAINTEDTYSIINVTATFKTANTDEVPLAMALVDANDATYEPVYGNYDWSVGYYGGEDQFGVSEGWGKPEGELYLDLATRFPMNADNPIGVVYTDSSKSLFDLASVSMNDAAGNKTRAQISANQCIGEYATIESTILNADGSQVKNLYVSDHLVYVKMRAPYEATNAENSDYISGLKAGDTYYARAQRTTAADGFWYSTSSYFGKAVEGLGVAEKKVTGFKRLNCWPDFMADGTTRNSIDIRTCYNEEIWSDFSSIDIKVTFVTHVPREGLYVTWPYGATDDIYNDYTYTGGKIMPEVWVWYNGTRLDSKFYKISYKNNVQVTTKKKATITVKGTNGVKGTAKMDFDIVPASIAAARTYARDGYARTITVQKGQKLNNLKFNLYLGANNYTKPLKAKKDYKVESATTVFNNDGWILVTGINNYTDTALIKVIVVDKYAKLNVKINEKKVPYNYYRDDIDVVKPSMTVTAGKGRDSHRITETLDYQIYVEESVDRWGNLDGAHNVGTYKVYIAGQGKYGGKKLIKKTFKITPVKLTDVTTNMDQIKAYELGYQYDNILGANLERGIYKAAANEVPVLKIVANNINLGYAYDSKKYVKFDNYGIDKYAGKVVGKDYQGNEYLFKRTDSVYVKITKNKKLGTAKYTINFGGNFKGTKAIKGGEFKIAETSFEGYGAAYDYGDNTSNLIIPDVAYTGKAGTYFSTPYFFYYNDTDNIYGGRIVDGFTATKQMMYKKGRDYTIKYYKDRTCKDEITNKNKLELIPGQEFATVVVKIEGKGGYGLSADGKAGAIIREYRVYDPKRVQGGSVDLKTMKYYNGDAKPVKVQIQNIPGKGYVITTTGKNATVITNSMRADGYNFTENARPKATVSMYGDLKNGKVLGYKNLKLKIKGQLDSKWYR